VGELVLLVEQVLDPATSESAGVTRQRAVRLAST